MSCSNMHCKSVQDTHFSIDNTALPFICTIFTTVLCVLYVLIVTYYLQMLLTRGLNSTSLVCLLLLLCLTLVPYSKLPTRTSSYKPCLFTSAIVYIVLRCWSVWFETLVVLFMLHTQHSIGIVP